MHTIATIAKSILAGLVAFLGALGTALTTGESLREIDAKTWLAAIVVGLLGTGIVYTVPNKSVPTPAPAPATPPQPAP